MKINGDPKSKIGTYWDPAPKMIDSSLNTTPQLLSLVQRWDGWDGIYCGYWCRQMIFTNACLFSENRDPFHTVH